MHEAEHRGLPWACLHWFPFSTLRALSLSLSLFLFISLFVVRLPLSLLYFEHRYLWNLLHRARCIPLRSFASRLVSSCLEEAPGTRNVSISVTIDGVPSRVSSPDLGGRGSTHVRKPVLRVLVTEYRVFSQHWRYRFQRSKNTPTTMLSLAACVC